MSNEHIFQIDINNDIKFEEEPSFKKKEKISFFKRLGEFK